MFAKIGVEKYLWMKAITNAAWRRMRSTGRHADRMGRAVEEGESK
jgi:hypothetical protein